MAQERDQNRADGVTPVPDVRPYRSLTVPPDDVRFPWTRELETSIAFLEFTGQHLGERKWPLQNGATRIILAEHARMASLYYAVLSLALDGCGVEGELLCRPMFEALVTAHWAHSHASEAAERYAEHERYLWHLHATARKERGVGSQDPEWPGLTNEELVGYKRRFGKYGQLPWTGHSIVELADEYLAGFSPESVTVGVMRDYLALDHPFINWSLHSTAIAGSRSIEPYDDTHNLSIVGPSDHGVRNSFVHAFNCYSGISWLLVKHFQLKELEPAFEEATRAVERILDSSADPRRVPATSRDRIQRLRDG